MLLETCDSNARFQFRIDLYKIGEQLLGNKY